MWKCIGICIRGLRTTTVGKADTEDRRSECSIYGMFAGVGIQIVQISSPKFWKDMVTMYLFIYVSACKIFCLFRVIWLTISKHFCFLPIQKRRLKSKSSFFRLRNRGFKFLVAALISTSVKRAEDNSEPISQDSRNMYCNKNPLHTILCRNVDHYQ